MRKRFKGWSIKPIFAWYDLWVGIFWDSRKRKLYILPLPCVGVVIAFSMRHNAEVSEHRGADAKQQTNDATGASLH